ncbi:MAG: GerAB/ArcD/ProY family transporter [Clostridia bacterium]|nr:GerAB/ArcD/ProY family transporter [Clostridia bacterium]
MQATTTIDPDFRGDPKQKDAVVSRQIALFAAFVLPIYKLLEAPSVLARFTGGDLLLPALLHYVFQTGVLIALLVAASRSEKTLFERLDEKLGKWSLAVYISLAAYFLFASILPLLDLEKFVYAAFFDTAPTLFSFAFFFLFCAFVCTKGIKAMGRIADLSLFLFLLPFLALLVMALGEADFTNLLPFFEYDLTHTVSAFSYTSPHFSDVAFLLPLIGNLRFKKGDGVKIGVGYGVGSLCTLLFLGVFYGLYSSIAWREHYAFSKIAQYFPALSVIGRIDFLFVYMLCIVLFFYVAAPLYYTAHFTAKVGKLRGKTAISFAISFAAFLFVLFCNKYYDAIYAFFGTRLFPIFLVFSLAPTAFLLLKKDRAKPQKEAPHA